MLSPALVRGQLRRLLAHPLFANSKRYPVLLAYTVEQTLLGNGGSLKERTIGVEAFGRDVDYDVATDPVVRMTAAEVRKRLSQYYYDREHAAELIVELPVGSYVPSFREALGEEPGEGEGVAARAERTEVGRESAARGKWGRWVWVAGAIVCAAVAGFAVGRVRYEGEASSVEQFWGPVTGGPGRVTYCLGEPALSVDRERLTPGLISKYGNLDVTDVVALARSIVPLVPRNRPFRVLGAAETTFSQLREGPSVLIGAYDNPWTMRITKDLPFRFEYDEEGRKIVDRKGGGRRAWRLRREAGHTKGGQDYAIVGRIHDKTTGQAVIILGGILGEGTEAASELVSNAAYLDALLRRVPRNWRELNLEAVIETQVIGSHAGPPTVVAVETW